jgi:transposase
VEGLLAEMKAMRQRVEALEKRVTDLEAENAALRTENAALRAENTALRAENTALRNALEEERRAGKRQASPFSRGIRKANPKKPGRKPGGPRSRRSIPTRIDRTIVVPPLLICPHCSGAVRLGGVGYQYQTDLPPIEPMTTAFEIHYGFCTQCGRRVQARHPEQISDATGAVGGVQIGPHAIALAAHLNKVCGVSYERIAEMFGQVFGLELERSTIARALLRLADRAEATYRGLIETIRGSPVVYPDETGWRIGGDKAWLWAVTTLTATVYLIERGRGFPEAAKILGEAFAGVIGADGWAPYRRFSNAERQLCLAHLLRRCKELLEVPPTEGCANYIREIKAVLQKALALRDRRDEDRISTHGLRVSRGQLEAKLDRLLDEPDLHDESIRFAMHLLKNRDAILLFLKRPDVEATNFRAEQAIRPAVVNRKTSGGNRTDRGANAQAILMSILRTCKQRSLGAMSVFTQILLSPTPVAHSLGR